MEETKKIHQKKLYEKNKLDLGGGGAAPRRRRAPSPPDPPRPAAAGPATTRCRSRGEVPGAGGGEVARQRESEEQGPVCELRGARARRPIGVRRRSSGPIARALRSRGPRGVGRGAEEQGPRR